MLKSFIARRVRRSDRGAVLVIAVPALAMAIAAAALGVDIGRIALDKRNDQNVADLAALDAARAVGFILNTTNQAGYDAAAQAAAVASATRNGFAHGVSGRTVAAVAGTMNSSNVFAAGGTSAVQVTITSYLDYAFRPNGRTVTATAVAHVGSPIAAFSIGSNLVGLDTSKSYLDPMLKSMLGASGNLTAVSYNGLATGNVTLGGLQNALIASGISVGTMSQLLNTDIKITDLLQATATALGTSTATTEINDLLAANLNAAATIKLSQLVNVATPSDSAALAGTVNVFQLVNGAAAIANGSNFATVASGVSIPGLMTVDAAVKVISPAQTAIGPVGTTAETAQVVLRLTLHLKVGLLGSAVNVTLDITSGSAHGTLTSIVCGVSPSIGVSASTAAATATASASTAITGTLTLSPSTIGATGPTALSFSHPTEFAPVSKRAPSAAASGIGSVSFGIAATGNILLNLVLAVLNPLGSVLSTALTNATSALTPILKATGITVGSADVTALGIYPSPSSCGGHPRLAS